MEHGFYKAQCSPSKRICRSGSGGSRECLRHALCELGKRWGVLPGCEVADEAQGLEVGQVCAGGEGCTGHLDEGHLIKARGLNNDTFSIYIVMDLERQIKVLLPYN